MISRKRILRFAIGKMLRQDGWAEKYNPKNQFHVNQYDYSSCKEYLSALREKWQDYEDPECDFEYKEYYVKALKRAWKKELDPYDEFQSIDLELIDDVNEYKERIDECREWKDEHD